MGLRSHGAAGEYQIGHGKKRVELRRVLGESLLATVRLAFKRNIYIFSLCVQRILPRYFSELWLEGREGPAATGRAVADAQGKNSV